MDTNNDEVKDPANYIIERFSQVQQSWSNSRITYRLKFFDSSIKRYQFLGDYFWIGNLHSKLRSFGVERPESVYVIDLDEAGISSK